jgi:hypothetical protein
MGSSISLRPVSPESEAAAAKLRSAIGAEYVDLDARRAVESRDSDDGMEAVAIGALALSSFSDYGGSDGGSSSSD